jgi:hypothetical protein
MEFLNHKNLSKRNKIKFTNFILLFFNGYSKVRFSKNGTIFLRKESFSLFNRVIKINFYKLLYEILPLELSYRKWNSPGLAPTLTKLIMDIISATHSTDDSKFESVLSLLYKEANGTIYYNLNNNSFDFAKLVIDTTVKKLESKRLRKEQEQAMNTNVITESKAWVIHNNIEHSSRITKKVIKSVISTGIAAALFIAINYNTVKLLRFKNYLHMLKPQIECHCYYTGTKEPVFDSS